MSEIANGQVADNADKQKPASSERPTKNHVAQGFSIQVEIHILPHFVEFKLRARTGSVSQDKT